MIRIALECALVFLLPSVAYFGYAFVTDPNGESRTWANRLDTAPVYWLLALGAFCLFGALAAFATLQDQSIDQPYAPAIFKNGKIEAGGKPQ